MKKTLIISLLLAICLQKTIAQSPKYLSNPNLDKFVGTWICNDSNRSVKLVLSKVLQSNEKFTSDWITGFYTYTKDGKIIENSKQKTIRLGNTISENGVNHPDKLYFVVYDEQKKKGGRVAFELESGKTDEAIWYLSNIVGARISRKGEEKPFDETFTLPTHMVFKKQP